jgi:hypothetical protein
MTMEFMNYTNVILEIRYLLQSGMTFLIFEEKNPTRNLQLRICMQVSIKYLKTIHPL